jgi:hypothetical protein
MKIKPEHYARIVEILKAALVKHPDCTRAGYEAVGMSAERHRWDLFRAGGGIKFLCDEVYDYANDTHINNALKKAVTELEVVS